MNSKKIKSNFSSIISVITIILLMNMYTDSRATASGKSAKEKQNTSDQTANERITPVRLAEAKLMTFKQNITLYAKAEAKFHAMIPVRIPGIIEHLYVDEGSEVTKGETVLFQIDNFLLEQAVINAKQMLESLKVTDKQRRTLVEIAKINLEQQKKDHDRYLTLFKKHAVSIEKFDAISTTLKAAKAQMSERQQFLALGREQAKQAIVSLKIAQKNLSDSIVKAPIDGTIIERFFEEGEMGKLGNSVFNIVNTKILDISTFIPAEYIPQIIPNKTVANVILNGKLWKSNVKLTYVSPSIDPKLHVFEIKCRVNSTDGKGEMLHPGQSVKLEIMLSNDEGVGIPTEAIIKRKSGFVAYTILNNRAIEIPVKTGFETNNYTMINGSEIKPGDKIVSMGQFMLNHNSKVSVNKD